MQRLLVCCVCCADGFDGFEALEVDVLCRESACTVSHLAPPNYRLALDGFAFGTTQVSGGGRGEKAGGGGADGVMGDGLAQHPGP